VRDASARNPDNSFGKCLLRSCSVGWVAVLATWHGFVETCGTIAPLPGLFNPLAHLLKIVRTCLIKELKPWITFRVNLFERRKSNIGVLKRREFKEEAASVCRWITKRNGVKID
jgi:hypothetical protein